MTERLTTLLPTRLRDGEDYTTVDDILTCQDLPEAVIRVPQWRRNGKALAIRVRALSLVQKEAILAAARKSDGTIDEVVQIEATLREGIVLPRFDPITAEKLRHKNPDALDQIFRMIWTLSALNQELIDAVVAEQTGAESADGA